MDLPALGPNALYGFHKVLSGHDLSENGVLAIEMGSGNGGNEKLGSVSVGRYISRERLMERKGTETGAYVLGPAFAMLG